MLSENLQNLRKARGLSQEELAERIHVVRQTVSKWEKGDKYAPFKYYTEDGSPLQLGRGKTDVNIVPLDKTPIAE